MGTGRTSIRFRDERCLTATGVVQRAGIAIPGGTWYRMPNDRGSVHAIMRNVTVAVEELMVFNDPEHFILETTPIISPARRSSERILRSNERPRYTLLRPKEIRERMRLPEPEKGKKKRRPHERRAHTRTLGSTFYKKKRGSVIVIPASWVGPSESAVGGKRYRVLLDR